jgi:hypothetical protein
MKNEGKSWESMRGSIERNILTSIPGRKLQECLCALQEGVDTNTVKQFCSGIDSCEERDEMNNDCRSSDNNAQCLKLRFEDFNSREGAHNITGMIACWIKQEQFTESSIGSKTRRRPKGLAGAANGDMLAKIYSKFPTVPICAFHQFQEECTG